MRQQEISYRKYVAIISFDRLNAKQREKKAYACSANAFGKCKECAERQRFMSMEN